MPHASRLKTILIWLAPTGIEVTCYVLLTLITLTVSNIEILREYLYVPESIDLHSLVLGSIDELLQRAFGVSAAPQVVTAIFWGLMGIIIYIGYWLVQNFSTEAGNTIAESKYIYPDGSDKTAAFKQLFFRSIFRIMVLFVFFVYGNLFVTILLPYWIGEYRSLVSNWSFGLILPAIVAVLLQSFALHIFVVLLRLLFLRKRIFGGEYEAME